MRAVAVEYTWIRKLGGRGVEVIGQQLGASAVGGIRHRHHRRTAEIIAVVTTTPRDTAIAIEVYAATIVGCSGAPGGKHRRYHLAECVGVWYKTLEHSKKKMTINFQSANVLAFVVLQTHINYRI